MEKGGKMPVCCTEARKCYSYLFIMHVPCVLRFQPATNGFQVVRGHWTFLREILIFERKKHTSNDYYIRYHDK